MSYFLKQTHINNRVYLQISETTYSKETKQSSNHVYKKIGFVNELIKTGIIDPIAYYKNVVKKMNDDIKEKKEKDKELTINNNKEITIGHFLFKKLFNKLNIKEELLAKGYTEETYNIFESLIFSRAVTRKSLDNEYVDTFNYLYNACPYNKYLIRTTIENIGKNYKDIIDIFNKQITTNFKEKHDIIYYDTTSSYLNLDIKKGGFIKQCLVLNEDLIPIDLYIKEDNGNDINDKALIKDLKKKYQEAKIIRISNTGVNYKNNIYNAYINKTNYILPLSLTSVLESDKEWILDKNDYKQVINEEENLIYEVKNKEIDRLVQIVKNDGSSTIIKGKQNLVASFNVELEKKKKKEIYKLVDTAKTLFYLNATKQEYGKSLKYLNFVNENGKTKIEINETKINNELKYAGYKLILTDINYLNNSDIFELSNHFWTIQDHFRHLRTQLDYNAVYSKNLSLIFGHYLLEYIVIVIYRLLETSIFKNKLSYNELHNFVKDLKLLKINDQYINISHSSLVLDTIEKTYKINLSKQFLNDKEVEKLFN